MKEENDNTEEISTGSIDTPAICMLAVFIHYIGGSSHVMVNS